jgi:hypothetical protein
MFKPCFQRTGVGLFLAGSRTQYLTIQLKTSMFFAPREKAALKAALGDKFSPAFDPHGDAILQIYEF